MGVDVARALAVVGMVAVHFAPRPASDDGTAAWWLGVPYGKASVLFALVAGVGVAILARRRPDTVRARLVYRSLWLLPLGLGLGLLDHPVAVILEYYAVWFLLAAPLTRVRSAVLLALAATLLGVGSLAVAWVGVSHPTWLAVGGAESPGGLVTILLLTGYYPTVTWFPVVLVGVVVGRLDLATRPVAVRLALAGVVASVAAYGLGRSLGPTPAPGTWAVLRSVAGHSEMPLAVLGATGFAIAVLGACLAASRRTFVAPLAAMGRGALTVYVGHLLVWHATGDLLASSDPVEAWVTVAWFTVLSTLAMWAWLRRFAQGPLEAAVRWPFVRLVQPLLDLAAGRPAGSHASGPVASGPVASGPIGEQGDPGVPPGES